MQKDINICVVCICYDFSTWVSNRHLKFNMCETERSFSPKMYPNQLSHCSKSHHHLPSQLDSQSLEDILESVSPHFTHLIRQSLLQILHVFQISSLSSISTTTQLIFPLIFLDHMVFPLDYCSNLVAFHSCLLPHHSSSLFTQRWITHSLPWFLENS